MNSFSCSYFNLVTLPVFLTKYILAAVFSSMVCIMTFFSAFICCSGICSRRKLHCPPWKVNEHGADESTTYKAGPLEPATICCN